MSSDGSLVQLYVYDLSGGMARSLSGALLGHQIEGIWHTSVVVRGTEHYFGGGINVAPAGSTPFGHPVEIISLGATHLDEEMIESLLVELAAQFTPETYSLFDNNCNTFSDALAQLLTGNGIPAHITGLPAAVLSTPFGMMIKPMLSGLEAQMKSMRSQAFHPHLHQQNDVGGDGDGSNGQQQQQQQQQIADGKIASSMDQSQTTAAIGNEKEETTTTTQITDEDVSAMLAAEKELEAAVAVCAFRDMDESLEELDLKEGRATPLEQLGEEATVRLATEAAVKREFEKLMAAGGVDEKEAEALAVENVAAAATARMCGSGVEK